MAGSGRKLVLDLLNSDGHHVLYLFNRLGRAKRQSNRAAEKALSPIWYTDAAGITWANTVDRAR